MTIASTASIAWFAEIGIDDRPTVGGKGASLGELTRAGIPVPPGFVITTRAFEYFLESLEAEAPVRAAIAALDAEDMDAVARTTARIRPRIEGAAPPAGLYRSVVAAYRELCGDTPDAPVAVRSSATSEDSEDASFAGLQDTYLWVRGAGQLFAALQRCWASLYSEPSVAYRRRLGLPEEHAAMGVVVQRMVDARCAGVMFTRSPVTGDRSVIAINASWGLGSAVVSGEVTPDEYLMNKVTGETVRRTISCKGVRHVPLPGGGVRDEPVPAEQQLAPCLSQEELAELVRIGRRVEDHYGRPQDIEWAIDRSGVFPASLYLLQSRPETVWTGRDSEPLARPKANPFDHVLAVLGGGRRPAAHP